MFNWRGKHRATNAIFLQDGNVQEGRPFKSRFLQAGLVKYDFGVCLLKKETIDKFINTFVGNPVIINHKDDLTEADRVGTINKIWFSAEDGWFWCEGVITDNTAVELIEKGYNVSCQYRITEYADNDEGKLHNANPYDKEILNGVFEHLAIVENPRYEDAFIAVNAYIAENFEFKEDEHPRDDEGKFTDGNNSDYKKNLKSFIEKAKDNPNERTKLNVGKVSDKLHKEAQEHGLDLTDYTHDLDVSGTRHAYKNHGDEKKEANRGQIALTDDDFEKIPEIVDNYDSVEFGEKDKKGTPLIKYKKQYKDGTTYYVEEVRTKHKNLTIKTMYKTKKASNSGIFADLNPQRSEYTSNIIIANNSDDFNPASTITVNNDITKYQKVFEWLQTTKGESMDNETKGLFSALVEALKARNEAEDEKDKKNAEKATNEDVDKRKLIDEIGGILKGKVDEELWRTIIGKV
ncbi:MAG: DUF2213 domain-containing protein, partial [Bacilli bacterium]|nr:DUF2213 domain-containing protein [Bacilli bacterium]